MHVSSSPAPGFGALNPEFYNKGQKSGDQEVGWSADVERAVRGDMWRSLREMRRLANVEAQDTTPDSEDEVVCIKAPLSWGTFIIEGKDGRVVVVEADGEYDSGLPGEKTPEWNPRRKSEAQCEQRNTKGESHTRGDEKTSIRSAQAKGKAHSSSRRSKAHDTISTAKSPPQDPGSSPLTKSFMTGGANGWSSSSASSSKPPSTVVVSPPGAWPSPEPSTTKQSHGTSAPGYAALWKDDQWWKLDDGSAGLNSATHSNASWKEDVEAFYSCLPHQMPIQRASSASDSRGSRKSEAQSESAHSSQRRVASETLTLAPYSWRRQLEELSTYSTQGLSRSHSPSEGGSRKSSRQADFWVRDVENQSTKTHSTYRAPTVEDAPETPPIYYEQGFGWDGRDSKMDGWTASNDGSARHGEKVESASWRNEEGRSAASWDAPSQAGSGGNGTQGKKTNGGSNVGNETWLDSRWGGVGGLKTEWPTSSPAWRDV